MSYLIRFDQGKPHTIAHYIHEIEGVLGALCSQTPKPAVGDQSRSGTWQRLETLPSQVDSVPSVKKRNTNWTTLCLSV